MQQPLLGGSAPARGGGSESSAAANGGGVAARTRDAVNFLRGLLNGRGAKADRDGSDLDPEEQRWASGSSASARRPPAAVLRAPSFGRGLMHSRAVEKYQELSATYKSRRQLQLEEDQALPRHIIHPHDIIAQCWWTFILCTVVVTLFMEPFNLAFSAYPGLYPLSSPDTLFAVGYGLVYAGDVLLNFFVAYYAPGGELVTDLPSIARHYAASGRLAADVVTTIPFDWIVLGAMGLQQSNNTTAWYVSLLRLLRLGRAYRLYGWVRALTYNQTLSLMVVTLTRNFALCFFTVHWGATGLWYIAKQSGFADTSWVGANMEWVGEGSALDKWVYSMYFSIISFSTVGYGDLHAYSVPEAAFIVVFMFFSLGVSAYFVATSVLLVVENEKRTGAYRESLIVLDDFAATHGIPPPLLAAMKGHLRLHFSSAESSDEAVLGVYPTTIRRRVLRHLYNGALTSCWLFRGAKQKFIDALLLSAKVELFMPKVDIVSAGDSVNELQIVLAGVAACERAAPGGEAAPLLDGDASVHGGSTRVLGPGDTAGEMAFFTEAPCTEYVRTVGMCRVLVVPRVLYDTLAAAFPISSAQVMENLVARAEEMIACELPDPATGPILAELEGRGLELKFASPELGGAGDSVSSGWGTPGWRTPPSAPSTRPVTPPQQLAGGGLLAALAHEPGTGAPLRAGQQQVLANLLRVRALAKQTQARLEQQRTNAFLNACSAGNLDRIRVMLQEGTNVNCCDYDGRTGLMLAAAKGFTPALRQLLAAGAAVNVTDHMGGSALLEACKAGHDDAIEALQAAGARLLVSGVNAAALLCSAAHEGNSGLLRRLLTAGAPVNAEDYDKRTALHIAAADGNVPAVKLLIEVGDADATLVDRWDQTPLDEARRAGAVPVVEYLGARVAEQAAAAAATKFQLWQAQAMLNAASGGDTAGVARLLERGCPPDACDYDKRTGLMLAAAQGHGEVVAALLRAGANPNARDNLGGSALLEAVKAGHDAVLAQLVDAGASLQLSPAELASALCGMVLAERADLLRAYIAAGANVSAGDYNQQTPLHMAAATGKLHMVKLLVEEGGAELSAADRWGATPLAEAKRVGAADVVAYLGSPAAEEAAAAARLAAARGRSPLAPTGGGAASEAPGGSLDRSSSLSSSKQLHRMSSSSANRGVVNQRAAAQFQQLSTTFKSRRQLQLEEDQALPRHIIHPHDIMAQCWWTFILCTVVVTLFVEPYSLAFSHYPGLHPLTAPDTILAIIFTSVYSVDVLLNFFVAYYEDGELVTDLPSIARHYARWRLWVDLVTTIPFDWIVLGAMGLQQSNNTTAWYVSLLRLLRLGRAYRLYGWVRALTYNQTISLVVITLVRNFALCFFVVHWAACIFWYIAKQSGFADTSWVGAARDWIGTATAVECYVYSYYCTPEAVFTIVYVFINIGVAAYIIGTITLLVVKGDEKTGAYRARLNVLEAYTTTHEVPRTLKSAMKGHLRLHFSSADSSDEAVLGVYPTAIRRRVLRHLYNGALTSCWLFVGAKQKFLDALLATAKVELLMPKVDLISDGDHVNDLFVVVAGGALAERGSGLATTGHPEELLLASDGASVHGGATRFLGPGDAAGEMAFFTESASMETVRTMGMCRVLVVPRVLYNSLVAEFPISSAQVMENLVARAEEMVEDEFPGASAQAMGDIGSMRGLEHKHASAEAGSARVADGLPIPRAPSALMVDSSGMPLRAGQQQVLANLLRVRALAKQTQARLEQQRTNAFLNACSAGNLDRIRVMLQEGTNVNCCDYDGRTGLMLAAAKGFTPALRQLLAAGATVNVTDHMGGSALLEACKGGHDEAIELLKRSGARLAMAGVQTAAHLCTAVFDGDMQLLRRLVLAGANVNAIDYDRRTALHIAAADGNLPVVKLLIEVGDADATLVDRWDQTPLDEARRAGAVPVVEYLGARVAEQAAAAAATKFQLWQAQAMLNAASGGDTAGVARLLERGCPPDACDYDKRTGLMLAAAQGHGEVVAALLRAGANPNARDNLGGSALLEAVKAGHDAVLAQLVDAGASLQLSPAELASALCGMVLEGEEALLRRYIAAGADVAAGDYDKRTPLHIAAAEGKLSTVKLLVEEGGAELSATDRWGATPLAEAKRVGAADVVAYLGSPAARSAAAASASRRAAVSRSPTRPVRGRVGRSSPTPNNAPSDVEARNAAR
ncbi:AKT1 [Scenedesmus sp. PABB004]|nr:AKT1 [Scenedesmus sp. PABB004]